MKAITMTLLGAAVTFSVAFGRADIPNTAAKDSPNHEDSDIPQVTFKLTKPMKLKGSERLDSRVTFQGGHRLRSLADIDQTKPYCQVFFNSDAVEQNHGLVGPSSLTPKGMDAVRVLPVVANTGGFVSVQVSESKAQAMPEEKSFSVSCTLYSNDAAKISLFTYGQITKILGSLFQIDGVSNSAERQVAQKLKE
jgi:hypothetical protein